MTNIVLKIFNGIFININKEGHKSCDHLKSKTDEVMKNVIQIIFTFESVSCIFLDTSLKLSEEKMYLSKVIFCKVHDLLWGTQTLYRCVGDSEDGISSLKVLYLFPCVCHCVGRIITTHTRGS